MNDTLDAYGAQCYEATQCNITQDADDARTGLINRKTHIINGEGLIPRREGGYWYNRRAVCRRSVSVARWACCWVECDTMDRYMTLALCVLMALIVTAEGLIPTFLPANCPVGTEADEVFDVCVPCRIGYFRGQGLQERCEKCPPGFITEEIGAGLISDCDIPIGLRDSCDSGYQWSSEEEGCTLCPYDTYRTKGEDYWCVRCPDGTSTAQIGSHSLQQCYREGDCPAGLSLSAVTSVCEPCPVNTYRQYLGSAACQPCPEDRVTLFWAAQSPFDCIAKVTPEDVFTSAMCPSGTEFASLVNTCRVCPKDWYRKADGERSSCHPCDANTYTLYEGAVDKMLCMDAEQLDLIASFGAKLSHWECPVGTEWTSQPEGCRPCPLGTYRDQSFQASCQGCPDDQPTPRIGAKHPAMCGAAESTSDKVFQYDECPPGMEWNAAPPMCILCDHGFFSLDGISCMQCVATGMTPTKGATSPAHCIPLMLPDNVDAPFFHPDACPAGTEWDLTSNGCRPCPLGFYRPGNPFIPYCQACPSDVTTLTEGARDSFMCNIPRQVPEKLPISRSIGCLARFQPMRNWTYCEPCPLGTYKGSEGWSDCESCPDGDAQITTTTRYTGSPSISNCIPTNGLSVELDPSYGPQAGGTLLHINIPLTYDIRVSQISVQGLPCVPLSQYISGGLILCRTAPSRQLPAGGTVDLQGYDDLLLLSDVAFTYKQNPVIESVNRMKTFFSGGVKMIITGRHLDSVSAPSLILTSLNAASYGNVLADWVCTVRSSTTMECPLYSMKDVLSGASGSRKKRSAPDENSLPSLMFDAGLYLDGVTTYRNLSKTFPDKGPFRVYDDPEITRFVNDGVETVSSESYIIIEGRGLNTGVLPQDIRVVSGLCEAEVTNIQYNSIRAKLCADLDEDQIHTVTVHIGSLTFPAGKVQFKPVSGSSGNMRILIPLFAVLAGLLLIIMILIVCYGCKKKKVHSTNVVVVDDGSGQGKVVEETFESGTLPPLPVDSVFGRERVTDKGLGMRALALPDDGVQLVETDKTQDLLRYKVKPAQNGHTINTVTSSMSSTGLTDTET